MNHTLNRIAHYAKPQNFGSLFPILSSMIGRELRYHRAMASGKNLLGDYAEVYETMCADYADAGGTTSRFWKLRQENMRKEMYGRGLSDFKQGYWNRQFSFFSKKEGMFMSALWQYYKHVKQKDTMNIFERLTEPRVGNPEYLSFEKNVLTWDFVQSVDEFYKILHYSKMSLDEEVVFCEIGGGYGRLGWLFLEMFPNGHYVSVDLPESLITAYYYFNEVFGKEKIANYSNSRGIKNLIRSDFLAKRATFILPDQFFRKRVEPFDKDAIDFYANIYSFSEMLPSSIKEYFSQMNEFGGKFIYLKNRVVEHNLVDGIDVHLSDYPLMEWMKVAKSEPSQPFPDMVEEFISL